MFEYLDTIFDAYVAHFGAWITFMFAVSIYKNGLPEKTSEFKAELKSALILASLLSLFSSQGHTKYIKQFVDKKTLGLESCNSNRITTSGIK